MVYIFSGLWIVSLFAVAHFCGTYWRNRIAQIGITKKKVKRKLWGKDYLGQNNSASLEIPSDKNKKYVIYGSVVMEVPHESI